MIDRVVRIVVLLICHADFQQFAHTGDKMPEVKSIFREVLPKQGK